MSGQASDPNRFVSVFVAAKRLQVCPATIRRWIKTGRLPAERHPGRLRIRASDLERFRAQASTSIHIDHHI